MMEKATGTHLAWLDDDDVYTDNAIDLFREHACDVPVFFRMRYKGGGELWRDQELRYGNLGTPCLLIPNIPEKLGEWNPHAGAGSGGGDFMFAQGCVRRMGAPIWRTEVVCLIRPE